MMIFSLGFPLFFIMMGVGFLVGAIAVAVILGTLSFLVVLGLIYGGVIRISPILDATEKLLDWLAPGVKGGLMKNIQKSFTVEGSVEQGQKLFVFHPHGMFSTSQFFHIGTNLTSWPVRGVRPTAISWGKYVPFGTEIYERFRCVGSDYTSMKEVLEEGTSLAVTLGGIREILHIRKGAMELSLSKKRGVFRMAIETGVPLVPVLCYGENEQFQLADIWGLQWIQELLIGWGVCLPIPRLSSWKRWAQLFSGGLETPIHCVIGDLVTIEKEDTIESLRERYIDSLKKLYEKTRPSWYKEDLLIL